MQLFGAILVDYTQPSTMLAYVIQNSPSTINLPATTSTISIEHGRKLSNLVKIYIDNIRYNGCNDSFTFKLAIFYNICSRADISSEVKIKAFPIMLKGLALDYYYSNINTNFVIMNFD